MKSFYQDSDKFVYFSILSFFFIALVSLGLSKDFLYKNKKSTPVNNKELVKLAAIPELDKSSSFPIVSAQAALAIDLASNSVLYEKDPDKTLLPASTTKIITALTAMDFYKDESILTVGKVKVEGQKMGLVQGEKIRAGDLFRGLLLFSANDAAEVLAENYPGGRGVFIIAMNLKARQLNLPNSYFVNPTGLDGNSQLTTARDLTIASNFAMRNPRFSSIVGLTGDTVKSLDGKIAHKLVNINKLVGKVEGVLGVKTGWTEEARENLVTYIERNNHQVIITLLSSQDRFGETKELIDWIFKNYKWSEPTPSLNSTPL